MRWHPRRRSCLHHGDIHHSDLGHGDVGSATVLVVAMAGVLMFVMVALATVSGLVAAQRRAQSAADLTALAAAAGETDPCAVAHRTATANGAALDSCAVDGEEVRVTVSVAGPTMPGRDVRVTAEARAGPG